MIINEYHIYTLGISKKEELEKIRGLSFEINKILIDFLTQKNILLIDFKLEFGKDKNGNIYLADEISPDTCRFWDKDTKEKLDKDRFRRNLGHVEDAYQEILKRLEN